MPSASYRGLFGTGLMVAPRRGVRSLGVAVLAGAGFGGLMAMADAGPFADAVPPVQHELVRVLSAAERIGFFAPGAFRDEIVLRLCGMTAVVWGLGRAGLNDPVRGWLAIAVCALVLYPLLALGYFLSLDWNLLVALRELLLHGGAGILWGWLYWRHGWLSALAGHLAAHLSLQPLLTTLA